MNTALKFSISERQIWLLKLFHELALSTNPLDKRFCFCHTTLVDYDLVQRYQNSVKEVIFITWKFLQTYNYIELIELAKLNIFCTSRNPDKFQKILTSRRRRPDFGLQRRRFESLKRRFKNQKRRFCFACLKNQWKSTHCETTGKMAKIFDILAVMP